jgi:hypothetical protein
MGNNIVENKKGFLQNDRRLVCGMLVFYGVCIIGVIAATFLWLNQRNQTISANATTTAAARSTELAQYELIDRFDSNTNLWRTGDEDDEYWKGSVQVTSGVYIWDVQKVKQGFVLWADSPGNEYVKNYDTYVETKFEEVTAGNPCSGLIFRKALLGWNTGGYAFAICNAGYFRIHYHNYKDGWQEIKSQYHPSIQPSDWNRLEVLVNGSHFTFLINNQVVYETDDDRQPTGDVALMIEAEETGAKILFDNFGYQSR